MSKQASEFQEKVMSIAYRGKEIFKPLNTGHIDEYVSCIREFVANIFFYTKNGTTIMIDAGYNYERLKEKMRWLDLNPEHIQHILVTHQDTDHVGAVETDSDQLFRNAMLYIGEIENQYLTGEKQRKVYFGTYKLPLVKSDNPRKLLKDGEIFYIDDIKIECFLVPGHTWGHMVYLIDDTYLFTGDALWFGADGGYSFIHALAENNELAKHSLALLEQKLRERKLSPIIITGHTGWTDNLDFAFAHINEVCNAFRKQKPHDPNAPYDAYDESDDTEVNARTVRLSRTYPRESALEIQLSDVQETALIPLAIKANESKRPNHRIYDAKAVEIIDSLNIDTENYDKFMSHEGVVARTIMFDTMMKKILKKYPDAVVVNIGCGFDDRFSRVDNGKIRWYNVDLPDSIAVRRKVFAERDREFLIEGDLFGDNWSDEIPADGVTVIIAEGLLMYFTEEQVSHLLKHLLHKFRNGCLLAELMHPAAAGNSQHHDTVKATHAQFKWGITDGRELEQLCGGWKLLSENSFFEEMKKYTALGKIGDLFFREFNDRLAVYAFRADRSEIVRIMSLPDEKLNEISALIGESFWEYPYQDGEGGLKAFIPTREAMNDYMKALVVAGMESGTFYGTANGEGYILITDSEGSHPNFKSVLKMMLGMKNSLGGWKQLMTFLKAANAGSQTLEQTMKQEKRPYVKVEMLLVTKPYQGQGYMRKLLEYAFSIAEKKHCPCILDTDAVGKCDRYVHLGMKLVQTREAAGYKVYDLIREEQA